MFRQGSSSNANEEKTLLLEWQVKEMAGCPAYFQAILLAFVSCALGTKEIASQNAAWSIDWYRKLGKPWF